MTEIPTDATNAFLDVAALLKAVAAGDEEGADRMVRGFDQAERIAFSERLKEGFEAELWLYTRAAELVHRVIVPTKENQ
ncbi:hypothetical protein [Rhodococcoides fascians]|uniref:hypothetical protein n=1 Tax=Rhodococcoides fascians TaxID=1828 RepID=UPI00050C07BC|nr:hypothetical protein [Rhodococcus fascians]